MRGDGGDTHPGAVSSRSRSSTRSGAGDMGVADRARDTRLARDVAVATRPHA